MSLLTKDIEMYINKMPRNKENNYGMISNLVLNSKQLSFADKGFLTMLLSLKPTDPVTVSKVTEMSKEHSDTIRKYFCKMEKLGFVCDKKLIKTKGSFPEYHYKINEHAIKQIVGSESTDRNFTDRKKLYRTVRKNTDRTDRKNTYQAVCSNAVINNVLDTPINNIINNNKNNIYINDEISKKETVKESDKNPETLPVKSESKKIDLNQKANLPVQETASFTEQKERKEALLKILKDNSQFPSGLIDNPDFVLSRYGVAAIQKQLELTKYDRETDRFPGVFINRLKANSDVKPENYRNWFRMETNRKYHVKYSDFLKSFCKDYDKRFYENKEDCYSKVIEGARENLSIFAFDICFSINTIRKFKAEKFLENKEKMLPGYNRSVRTIKVACEQNIELTKEICKLVLNDPSLMSFTDLKNMPEHLKVEMPKCLDMLAFYAEHEEA